MMMMMIMMMMMMVMIVSTALGLQLWLLDTSRPPKQHSLFTHLNYQDMMFKNYGTTLLGNPAVIQYYDNLFRIFINPKYYVNGKCTFMFHSYIS